MREVEYEVEVGQGCLEYDISEVESKVEVK
jgi:hypothetical protein